MAFSPDEKYFYVDNWDDKKKVIMRYEVNEDGTLSAKCSYDMNSVHGEDALDGTKIDESWTFPGRAGCDSLHPRGKHLGTVVSPEHRHNMASGDDDGKTLYPFAETGLYRIKLNVPGIRPPLAYRELAKRWERRTQIGNFLIRSSSKLSAIKTPACISPSGSLG